MHPTKGRLAGIVEQHINSAEMLARKLDETAAILGLGKIARFKRNHLASGRAYAINSRPSKFSPDITAHDFCPFARKGDRRGMTNGTTCPRYNANLALEPSGHFFFLFRLRPPI